MGALLERYGKKVSGTLNRIGVMLTPTTIVAVWLICIFCVLFPLASCSRHPDPAEYTDPIEHKEINVEESKKEEPPSQTEPTVWYGDNEGFAEQYDMTNWAWAIIDWDFEAVRDTVVASAYASPDAFEDLVLAVGSPGTFPVVYKGEKKGTEELYWPLYSPTFEVVTGPIWEATGELFPDIASDYVLLPASNKEGLLSMTYLSAPINPDWDYETEYYNHGRPAASEADISIMESRRNGRKVVHSEQIATVSDGGRVSLFQYETNETGMVAIAYINGEKCIERVFTTLIYDEIAVWASELPPETFPYVSLAMLYQSDGGLVIGFSRFSPEWNDRYILAEKDGKFVDFNFGYWEYDVWSDPQEYVQNTNGLINSEAWPELDPTELIGKWEGTRIASEGDRDFLEAYDYTFEADGTGTQIEETTQSTPITYSVENNVLIIKEWRTDIYNEKYLSKDYYHVKIEYDVLYLSPLYEPVCLLMARK